MNESSEAGPLLPLRLLLFGSGIGRGLDRNFKPPEGQERRGGGKPGESESEGSREPL